MFHSLCANGIKKECTKNRVKYGCWQFDFICIIPFILKWPYNIYSIRNYVLSIFGMVNGLSISFLNSEISFFVVPFYFFFIFAISLIFSMPFWLFVSETLSVGARKGVGRIRNSGSNAVCYYVTMDSNSFVSFTLVGLFCLAVYMLLCYYVLSSGQIIVWGKKMSKWAT